MKTHYIYIQTHSVNTNACFINVKKGKGTPNRPEGPEGWGGVEV
jgi:hypothetical protein